MKYNNYVINAVRKEEHSDVDEMHMFAICFQRINGI